MEKDEIFRNSVLEIAGQINELIIKEKVHMDVAISAMQTLLVFSCKANGCSIEDFNSYIDSLTAEMKKIYQEM